VSVTQRAPQPEPPAAFAPESGWSRRQAWAWGAARLRRGRPAADAAVEAEVLLRHAAGVSRAEWLAHPEAPLGRAAQVRYREWIRRRERDVPIAYLTGEREFFGIRFAVDGRVLVPRPETERLVAAVAAHLTACRPQAALLPIADIGTGSGAIAVALAAALPRASILATDIFEPALAVARGNAARHGVEGRIAWACGPDLAPLRRTVPPGGLDALVSNPPYIPTAEIACLPADVRDHEPRVALDGGPDGMRLHRAIVAGAGRYLAPGGVLALETAALWGQARAVAELVAATGEYGPPRIVQDDAGMDRVVLAVRTAG
jgi:release factor glutamine methyltransferase